MKEKYYFFLSINYLINYGHYIIFKRNSSSKEYFKFLMTPSEIKKIYLIKNSLLKKGYAI